MLLNNVVIGKGYKILQNDPSMTAPLASYNSVSQAVPFFGHLKVIVLTFGCIQ